MEVNQVIGRELEKKTLQQAIDSPDAEFIAVYGRRRVGKTFLIRDYYRELTNFEMTGINKASTKEQLENFSEALGKATGFGFEPKTPKTWFKAFSQLEQFLNSSKPKKRNGKKVVFFDEVPWLNTTRSRFLSALEHFWNTYASLRTDLILVVCGSAASWMIQHIVMSKGGLHNRLTRQIRLLPFTLSETETFLKSRKIKLTRFQIIEVYMALGGIPHYLKQISPGLSPTQIIDEICFAPSGLLRKEFDKLYSSLFDNSSQHLKIIKTLAKKKQGMTRKEILESVGIISGGTASKRFEELEESGFIHSYVPFGKKTNEVLFWLSDEYSLFYIEWISKLGKKDSGKDYWMTRINSPKRRAWAGYAFERLCMKHALNIKKALGIAMVETKESPWRYISSPDKEITGTQIDLLIDRRDQTINLCEIKFSETEFTIDKTYAKVLRQKMDTFTKVSKTRKSIFLILISPFGLKRNEYSSELIQQSLDINDLF